MATISICETHEENVTYYSNDQLVFIVTNFSPNTEQVTELPLKLGKSEVFKG